MQRQKNIVEHFASFDGYTVGHPARGWIGEGRRLTPQHRNAKVFNTRFSAVIAAKLLDLRQVFTA